MNGGILVRDLAAAVAVGLATAWAGVASATTTNYQYVQSIPTAADVTGVAVDSSGNVWAAEGGAYPVQEFSSTGTLLNQFGLSSYTNGATAVAFDSSGNVWVCGILNTLVEFNRSGMVLQSFSRPSFAEPTDMVVDSSGNLLVTQNEGSLQKFSSSGTLLGTIGGPGSGTGQLNSPWGVTLDPSGNIWVSDSWNNRIVEFNSNGNFLQQFGSLGSGNTQLNGPGGLAVDSSGNVWVADSGNNRIEGFSSTGVYVTQFGALGTGNGQFNNPSGLAMDSSGNIWVADMYNKRIEEFSSVPEPSTLTLLGIGAVSLLAYGWRRRTKVA